MTTLRLSELPKTQQTIAALLFDGVLVSRTSPRSGGWHVFCPRASARNKDLRPGAAGVAVSALLAKSVIRERERQAEQPYWRTDFELVPGALVDDR